MPKKQVSVLLCLSELSGRVSRDLIQLLLNDWLLAELLICKLLRKGKVSIFPAAKLWASWWIIGTDFLAKRESCDGAPGLFRRLARAQAHVLGDRPLGLMWLPLENIFPCVAPPPPQCRIIMNCWLREWIRTTDQGGPMVFSFRMFPSTVCKGQTLLVWKLWIAEQPWVVAGGIFSLPGFCFAPRILSRKEGKDER